MGTFDSARIASGESGCIEYLDSEGQGEGFSKSKLQIIIPDNSYEDIYEFSRPSCIDTERTDSEGLSEEEKDAETPEFLPKIPSLEIMRATTK